MYLAQLFSKGTGDADYTKVFSECEAREELKCSPSSLFGHTDDLEPHRFANMHGNLPPQCHLQVDSVLQWSRGQSHLILGGGVSSGWHRAPIHRSPGGSGAGFKSPWFVRWRTDWSGLGMGSWIPWVSVLFSSDILHFLKLTSCHGMRAGPGTNVCSFCYLPSNVGLYFTSSSEAVSSTFGNIKWDLSSKFLLSAGVWTN